MTAIKELIDTQISGELWAQLPDLGPCELVEGRTVEMTPTGLKHGKLELRLGRLLDDHARTEGVGEVYVGEVGIYTKRSPDTVRGADVVFISQDRLARNDPEATFLTVAPEIVIEILSPNDRAEQVESKIREYLGAGVLEVWIVDSANRTLRRHRSDPAGSELFDEAARLTTPILPGFELSISQLFTD